MPAPKVRAIMVSRTKPRMRDNMVMLLTLASVRSKFMETGCLKTQTGYSIPIYANNLTAPAVAKKGCLKAKRNLSGSLR